MSDKMGWLKDAVKDGALIELDVKSGEGGAKCSHRVLITPSLNTMTEKDKLRAARLLDSFKRTLNAWQFMGEAAPRVLKCYIDAKRGLYFECQAFPWDECGEPALVFAVPGQFLPDGAGVREMSPEKLAVMKSLSPAKRAEIKALAIEAARRALADPDAPANAKRAARELLDLLGKGGEGGAAE